MQKKGSAYAFRADIEDHSIFPVTTGERISLVNFTHANILKISENAHLFELDPWLTKDINSQNHNFLSFDFQSQVKFTLHEKLDYVLKQSQMYRSLIESKKKEIN